MGSWGHFRIKSFEDAMGAVKGMYWDIPHSEEARACLLHLLTYFLTCLLTYLLTLC